MTVSAGRLLMDEFARRLTTVEDKAERMNLALQTHLSVFEVLQKAANMKINFILGMLILVLLMSFLGPHDGIVNFLQRL